MTLRRALWLPVAALAVIGLGVFYAWRIELLPAPPNNVQDTIITEIKVGTPISPSEVRQPNPRLRLQSTYSTEDPIAARFTTSTELTAPTQVSIRLLDSSRGVVDLMPSQITLQPGSTTYCCWTIPTSGKYLLQFFRPENVITSIPLEIYSSASGRNPLLPDAP